MRLDQRFNRECRCFAWAAGACMSAASIVYGQASAPQPADSSTFRLSVDVNHVLIPAVVRDAKGNLVEDLKKEDFSIRDDGKPREIVGFQVESAAPAGITIQASSAPVAGNPASSPAGPPSVYPRFVVLAFDDWHLNATDMKMAKDAAAKIVATSLGKSDYAAVVTLSGRVDSGLTRDPAKLQQALASLQPNSSRTMNNNGCPTIDYYQAYRIVEAFDGAALDDLILQLMSCAGMKRSDATDAASRAF